MEFTTCQTCKAAIPLWEWYTGCPQCRAMPGPFDVPSPDPRMLHQKLDALARKFHDGSWVLELERDLTGGSNA